VIGTVTLLLLAAFAFTLAIMTVWRDL